MQALKAAQVAAMEGLEGEMHDETRGEGDDLRADADADADAGAGADAGADTEDKQHCKGRMSSSFGI